MLVDSKGTVFPFFVWKIYVFYWFFEALFGCHENVVFYAYLEPDAKGAFWAKSHLSRKSCILLDFHF